MLSLFLSNYNTTAAQKVLFPIFNVYSYRHFQEFCNPAISWKGRVIHLITSLVHLIPIVGAIVGLAEYTLFRKYQPQSPKKPIIAEVSADKLADADQKAGKLSSSRAQFEVLCNPQAPSNDTDEKKTQEKEDFPTKPEEQLEQSEQEATIQILSTPGLIAENQEDPPFTVYEFGEEDHWILTSLQTRFFPHAISPASLKKQRSADAEQYMALKLKRFSHANSLQGYVSLPSGK